ncbi:MAG: adaptor protein MecA [Firmicutes bacterium]|nr:adaptor protein MecA [Bacillota bacterium]
MKMEKINDYQIKFLLSQQDLKDRNITFGDLFQHSDKLQSLVREIMKLASERINFNVNENPVMVEARPHPEGIVLVVSRTPSKNDTLFNEEYKKHLSNLYNEFVNSSHFSNDFSDNSRNVSADPVIEDSETSTVLCFKDMKKLIDACKVCNAMYNGQSTLWKLKGDYYLVLKYRKDLISPSAVNCFYEYGEQSRRIIGSTNMLSEYGEQLIAENAVESLAKC